MQNYSDLGPKEIEINAKTIYMYIYVQSKLEHICSEEKFEKYFFDANKYKHMVLIQYPTGKLKLIRGQ